MVQTGVKKYQFIRLDSTNAVENFDCGDKDLNDFIVNRASDFQKHLYYDLMELKT